MDGSGIVDIGDMRFDPQAGVTKLGPASGGTRRKHGRLEQEAVMSGLGQVLDLSASGMRVLGRKSVPRGEFTTWIRGLGVSMTVRARVAWSKRRGMLRQELGLQFVNVTPDVARQLTDLAMSNRLRRAV